MPTRPSRPPVRPPAAVTRGRFEGAVTTMMRRYAQRNDDVAYREKAGQSPIKKTCPDGRGGAAPRAGAASPSPVRPLSTPPAWSKCGVE
ncbi:hypothetical protein WKI65_29965 [Streptomyces sp. MS1.AVA.3]|uniref:hypothetical protein n=1 Tax=Streptomyces decoyicus TaxID=249567 RepID=UPI0030BAB064